MWLSSYVQYSAFNGSLPPMMHPDWPVKAICQTLLLGVLLQHLSLTHASNDDSSFPRFSSFVIARNQTTAATKAHFRPLDVIRGDSEPGTDGTFHWNVLLHTERDWEYLQRLEQEGTVLSIGSPIVEAKRIKRQQRNLQERKPQFNDFSCYRSVEQILKDIKTLIQQYPDLVSTETIGPTYLKTVLKEQGHDIPVIRITNKLSSIADKAPVMVIAGLHPRELQPPELAMRLVEQLVSSFGNQAETTWILNRTVFHIIPIVNMDSRVYVQRWLYSYLRKNQRDTCPGSTLLTEHGVDLNRNFFFAWGKDGGASSQECDEDYHGVGPLSEPENQAVFEYGSRSVFRPEAQRSLEEAWSRRMEACPEDNPGVFVDIHSYGSFVIHPWQYANVHPPNKDGLYALASKLAFHGNYSRWGPFPDSEVVYPVAGGSGDTAYGVWCVPAVGLEVGNAFFEDCDHFESITIPIALPALMYAARVATRAFQIPRGPDIRALYLDKATKRLLVEADEGEMTEFFNGTTFIKTIRVYVNQHPYDDESEGMEMLPRSSTFAAQRETATLELPIQGTIIQVEKIAIRQMIDTSDDNGRKDAPGQRSLQQQPHPFHRRLEEGAERLIVYVEAENSIGYRGPIESFFVDVQEVEEDFPDPSPTPMATTTQPSSDINTASPRNATSGTKQYVLTISYTLLVIVCLALR